MDWRTGQSDPKHAFKLGLMDGGNGEKAIGERTSPSVVYFRDVHRRTISADDGDVR
jgi:hypothetical protein